MTVANYIALGCLVYLAIGVGFLFLCIVLGRPPGLFKEDSKDEEERGLLFIMVVGFWGILVPMTIASVCVGKLFDWGLALRKRIYGK